MRTRTWTSLVLALLSPAALALDPVPGVLAKSAIVIEERSGKILFEKDIDSRRFPASTTKILTGLLLIEKTRPTDIITAPADVEKVDGSSLHLKPGETLTASEMLYAVMLRSANDGAYTVARHISGSVAEFAKLMNERAKAIGCTHSQFNNPHGLNDPLHWTSARDLALIAREAMRRPEFRRVVGTRKYKVTRSTNLEDLWLISKNHPLEKDPTADGIKTGYTVPAGHCYVGSATRNGYRLITVILASKDWQADHFTLLDYGFRNFGRTRIEAPGEVLRTLKIESGEKEALPVTLAEPAYYAARKGESPQVVIEVKPAVALVAPIQKGTLVGTVEFSDSEGWRLSVPLLASESVAFREKPAIAAVLGEAWPMGFVGGIAVLTVGCFAVLTRRRARANA